MKVAVFEREFEMIESTSVVPGRRSASVVGEGRVWADAFVYDPKSKIVNFDANELDEFVRTAKKRASPKWALVLTITDHVIDLMEGIKRMFGGRYGGTFGYGQAGSMLAAGSTFLLIVVTLLAAVVIVPLSIATWIARKHIDKQISQESSNFVNQVLENFDSLEARDQDFAAQ